MKHLGFVLLLMTGCHRSQAVTHEPPIAGAVEEANVAKITKTESELGFVAQLATVATLVEPT